MSQINEKAPFLNYITPIKKKFLYLATQVKQLFLPFTQGHLPVCAIQMCALQENMESFNASGAKVVVLA